jgi:Na+-driven multidrug efflux pump
MALTVVIMLALGGGAYVFGHQLLGIYTSDAEVISCGMEILLYTTVTYFLCGLMDLFPGAMRGMGYSLVPMIISIIGTVGLRIVWIFWVFPKNRSLDVLFISYPASWILTILMQLACFWFVRKKVFRKLRSEYKPR